MYEHVEMRKVFAAEMERLMSENENIVYIDADLAKGIGTLNLHQKFPDRTFNVGVAEQNMTSIAAGLSSYGFIPFISTFTPFATRRNCDQIAVSCLYAQQNVKIIGSDPGISAQTNGGTHMSMEDIGVVRSIPNIVIFEPCDAVQLVRALPEIIAYEGTVYVRLWRLELEQIFNDNYRFDLFRADCIKKGEDVTIFASGYMVSQAMKAAGLLAEKGIDAEIVNIHTIKPIDADGIAESVSRTGAAVVCDNHNILGGLGSAVSEVLVQKKPVPTEFVGVEDRFGQVGDLDFLAKEYHLTPEDIAGKALRAVQRKTMNE